MKSNHSCRVCKLWLEGLWNRLKRENGPQRDLNELQRQMDQGMCAECEETRCRTCYRMLEHDGYSLICVNEVLGAH